MAELLGIKGEWPFRHPQKSHLCHDLFQDDGHGRASDGCCPQGFYEVVFQELESVLATSTQTVAARAEVDQRLDRAVRALTQ